MLLMCLRVIACCFGCFRGVVACWDCVALMFGFRRFSLGLGWQLVTSDLLLRFVGGFVLLTCLVVVIVSCLVVL